MFMFCVFIYFKIFILDLNIRYYSCLYIIFDHFENIYIDYDLS